MEAMLKVEVGIGILMARSKEEGKMEILLGLRKGSHGAGEWSFPGGKPMFFESFEDCAQREILEETGIIIEKQNLKKLTWTDDKFPNEQLHFATLYYALEENLINVEPQLMEPDKCVEWKWFDLNNIPHDLPMFVGCVVAIHALKNRLQSLLIHVE